MQELIRLVGQWWRLETVVVGILVVLKIKPVGVSNKRIGGIFMPSHGGIAIPSDVLTIAAAADVPDSILNKVKAVEGSFSYITWPHLQLFARTAALWARL
jgi:hypothetical protein